MMIVLIKLVKPN